MHVKRLNISIKPDPSRVLLQFFYPGNESRVRSIIQRVISLNEGTAGEILNQILDNFSSRHKYFEETLMKHYLQVHGYIPKGFNLSDERKLLIGSYFSKEYSVEASALFNPSIVPHPEQEADQSGSLKFILSLRAAGEGHISSIEFRTGKINQKGDVVLYDFSRYLNQPKQKNLIEDAETEADKKEANYEILFSGKDDLSERIIFPSSKTECNGMEDLRLVKFNDGNQSRYYGTFTAYDGFRILPQLLETDDFLSFRIRTMNGSEAKDKGMALFPKKIKDKYCMISRQDGENLRIMYSDDIHTWNNSKILKTPSGWWDFVQLGNCGSPIETEKGWLLLTHAVGPLRRYVMSAVMLDIDDPEKVIAHIEHPLIEPNEEEREGYVPNVVYSCGSIIHNKTLFIPYAMSDSASGFAAIEMKDLFTKLKF